VVSRKFIGVVTVLATIPCFGPVQYDTITAVLGEDWWTVSLCYTDTLLFISQHALQAFSNNYTKVALEAPKKFQ